MDTGSTFRAGSNTLRFAKYFASGIGEDNAGAEMTEVSTSVWAGGEVKNQLFTNTK